MPKCHDVSQINSEQSWHRDYVMIASWLYHNASQCNFTIVNYHNVITTHHNTTQCVMINIAIQIILWCWHPDKNVDFSRFFWSFYCDARMSWRVVNQIRAIVMSRLRRNCVAITSQCITMKFRCHDVSWLASRFGKN